MTGDPRENPLTRGIMAKADAEKSAAYQLALSKQRSEELYNQYKSSMAPGGALDPANYKRLEAEQQGRLTTALNNQYARMGLSGSSAAAGSIENAIRQNQLAWLSKQQSDQGRALQGLNMLNQEQYGQAMDWYKMEQQKQASENQLAGSIIGGGIGLLAGPAGGLLGAKVGGLLGGGGGGGGSMVPLSYESQNFGSIYGMGSDQYTMPDLNSGYGGGGNWGLGVGSY